MKLTEAKELIKFLRKEAVDEMFYGGLILSLRKRLIKLNDVQDYIEAFKYLRKKEK